MIIVKNKNPDYPGARSNLKAVCTPSQVVVVDDCLGVPYIHVQLFQPLLIKLYLFAGFEIREHQSRSQRERPGLWWSPNCNSIYICISLIVCIFWLIWFWGASNSKPVPTTMPTREWAGSRREKAEGEERTSEGGDGGEQRSGEKTKEDRTRRQWRLRALGPSQVSIRINVLGIRHVLNTDTNSGTCRVLEPKASTSVAHHGISEPNIAKKHPTHTHTKHMPDACSIHEEWCETKMAWCGMICYAMIRGKRENGSWFLFLSYDRLWSNKGRYDLTSYIKIRHDNIW